uniref:Uncharacterized protein n=1 Tax=Romanomermis culicivorax TaxID=13658 RepID=A0A915KT95_ROMCU
MCFSIGQQACCQLQRILMSNRRIQKMRRSAIGMSKRRICFADCGLKCSECVARVGNFFGG